ncbi:MAG: hypothetical protein WKF47_06380 [Geodermatophilaceae bacterium]
MKALERLAAEDEHDREQHEQRARAELQARAAEPRRSAKLPSQSALPATRIAMPAREKFNTIAAMIRPRRPTSQKIHRLRPLLDVILPAGENHDRGNTEQIGGLIAVRERAEAALIMPERQRGVREVERDRRCAASSATPPAKMRS